MMLDNVVILILLIVVALGICLCVVLSVLNEIAKDCRNNDDEVDGDSFEDEEEYEGEEEDDYDEEEDDDGVFAGISRCKVALLAAGGVLLLVAGFVFLGYMPNKAHDELNALYRVACEDGIDLVTESDLERADTYRKLSVVFDKDERLKIDYAYDILEKSIQRWDQITVDRDFRGDLIKIRRLRVVQKLNGKIREILFKRG